MNPTSLVLVLFYFLGKGPELSKAYLIKTWTPQDMALLGVSAFRSKCYNIPENLTLCYGIGYSQMFLPNHLNHDSMGEAISQSQIWNSLTRTNCHDDLRVFLCSMYAPVCLPGTTGVKPCRQLCENVRDACLPRMRAVGYEWPDILRCNQFPSTAGGQMCVAPRALVKKKCAPCRQAVTYENIISSHCMAPIVFKGRITSSADQTSRINLSLHRKKKFYKSGGLTRSTKRSLSLFLPRKDGCTCASVIDANPQDKWLIMGRKDGYRVKVTFVMPWQRRNRTFKRAVRSIRKRRKNICQYRNMRRGDRRNNNRNKQRRRKNGRRRTNGRRRRGRGRGGRRGYSSQMPTSTNATHFLQV